MTVIIGIIVVRMVAVITEAITTVIRASTGLMQSMQDVG
jgi:hypothetical protein